MTGDEELEATCRREWPRLVGLLSVVVGDRAVAEDLAQEALLRLCRDWPKVRRYDSPSAWLYRVAVNLARSHGRRASTAERLRRSGEVRRSPPPSPDDRLDVRDALAALGPRHRAVLALRYLGDLSVREAAHVLGCPEGTVKRLTSEAIHQLRAGGLVEVPAETIGELHEG